MPDQACPVPDTGSGMTFYLFGCRCNNNAGFRVKPGMTKAEMRLFTKSSFLTFPLFPANGIDRAAGQDHQQAEELSHAERAEDEAELHIRLAEEFDEETDESVAGDVERREGAGEGKSLPEDPENGKEMFWEMPLPDDLLYFLERLRRG